MTTGGLLHVLVIALMMLAGFNKIVGRFARSQGEIVIKSLPVGRVYDTVFLGNSAMGHGFDQAAYTEVCGIGGEQVLKLALGGVSAPEECLLLEEFVAHGNRARRVVLGFFDLHLEGYGVHSWRDMTGANNLGYFTDYGRACDVYELDALERLKFGLSRQLPVLVRRSNLWAQVEHLRRRLEHIGMQPIKSISFGQTSDLRFYPYLEIDREAAHTRMAELAVKRVPWSLPLRRIIESSRAAGAELVIMEMPLRPDRVTLCASDHRWTAYRDWCERRTRDSGATYIRGFDWSSTMEDFDDPVHMSVTMAHRFSAHLAAVLHLNPLPPSL